MNTSRLLGLSGLVVLCFGLLTGCEGTLGPGDAPSSHELYHLYGLDEGPNDFKRTPTSSDPTWLAEASPYPPGLAPVSSANRLRWPDL